MTSQATMPATARSSGGSPASPRARALSATGNGGRGTATGPLVRRIAAELDQLSEPVVVVLDDYHVIGNPACHASVEALTAHPVSGNHGRTEGRKHG